MGYRIQIAKNRGHRYISIVEDFYNPAIKRGSTRNIKTYGDLDKLLLDDPDIEKKSELSLKSSSQTGTNRRNSGKQVCLIWQ